MRKKINCDSENKDISILALDDDPVMRPQWNRCGSAAMTFCCWTFL